MNKEIPHGMQIVLHHFIKGVESYNPHEMVRCLMTLLYLVLKQYSLISDDLTSVGKVLERYNEYYYYVYECKLMDRKPLSYAHYMLVHNNVADKEE